MFVTYRSILLIFAIVTSVAAEGGGALEVISPATVTCAEDGSKCCDIPGVGASPTVYKLESVDETAYCSHSCVEEDHIEVIGPASITCPDEASFSCLDEATGNSLTATVTADGRVYEVTAYFQEVRCPESCSVEEGSVLVTGPATVVCVTNPTCRTLTQDLNSTVDDTGASVFEIDLNVEARCAASCEVTEMLEIVGPAVVTCPILGEMACIDSQGAARLNATENVVTSEVGDGGVYYCDNQCTITDSSEEVRGPAKVTCPQSSVKCTPGGSSGSGEDSIEYLLGDQLNRCSTLCSVEEESVQVTAPFEATCPDSALPCSPSTSSAPSGSTVTYSASTGDFRCSNKCQIEAMVKVYGPAEIKCAADTLNCEGIGGGFNPDGSSSQFFDLWAIGYVLAVLYGRWRSSWRTIECSSNGDDGFSCLIGSGTCLGVEK